MKAITDINDPRLVKAVGLEADRHFILLDVDAVFAPIIGG